MKPERCQATAASGQPCSATPRPGRPFCLWHDPEAEEARRELSRKGGAARSNRARAAKRLPPEAMSLTELQGVLSSVLRDVIAGKTEPGVGNCAAGLGRAIAAIAQVADLEERLTELEAAAGIANRGRA